MKNNKKGITLVALVITIIILLILAGVAIALVFGEDGIITRAKEAKYKSNFSEIQDKTMLYWTNCEQEDILNGQSREVQYKLPLIGQIDSSLIREGGTLETEIKTIKNDPDLNISSLRLYEINKTLIGSNAPHRYLIDLDDLQIYDYEGEEFRGKWHHTLKGLGVEGTGELPEEDINHPASIDDKRTNWNGNTGWLEPDIDGFNVDFTWMVYYNSDFTATYEMPIKDYITNNRPSTTEVNGVTYTLDDYANKVWANVKTKSNGIEAWWVWLPRYAYKMDDTNQETDVVFVDMNNAQLRKEDAILSDEEFGTYIVHPAFTEQYKGTNGENVVVKQLRGIWMSKYEASNFDNTNSTRIPSSGKCYSPNIEGFDRNYTYIEYFDKTTNTFTEGPNLASANLEEEYNNTNWYDYSNKVWANVKTVANGIESWWVWIPRYAYKMNETNEEVDIIFVDINDKPYDKAVYGSELKGDMVVHPAFNETIDGTVVKKLKGIWMSKFEASSDSNTDSTRSASSGTCIEPDFDKFDTNNTKIIYWNSDFSDTREVTYSEYVSSGKKNTIEYNGQTYTFYDYKRKIWANIKTEANGIEAWWVWIPRFAYGINETNEEIDVIFVELDDTPCDKVAYGNVIKPTMQIHPAFNEQYQEQINGEWVTTPVKDENNNPIKLKGIWMSKYEASSTD